MKGLDFMKDNDSFVILGGRKYYRTIAPILSKERWNEMEQLVKKSIIDDVELEFVLCIGSYEEIVQGKAFLFNEDLQSFLVNHRVIMGKEVVEIRYPDNSRVDALEMEALRYEFF